MKKLSAICGLVLLLLIIYFYKRFFYFLKIKENFTSNKNSNSEEFGENAVPVVIKEIKFYIKTPDNLYLNVNDNNVNNNLFLELINSELKKPIWDINVINNKCFPSVNLKTSVNQTEYYLTLKNKNCDDITKYYPSGSLFVIDELQSWTITGIKDTPYSYIIYSLDNKKYPGLKTFLYLSYEGNRITLQEQPTAFSMWILDPVKSDSPDDQNKDNEKDKNKKYDNTTLKIWNRTWYSSKNINEEGQIFKIDIIPQTASLEEYLEAMSGNKTKGTITFYNDASKNPSELSGVSFEVTSFEGDILMAESGDMKLFLQIIPFKNLSEISEKESFLKGWVEHQNKDDIISICASSSKNAVKYIC